MYRFRLPDPETDDYKESAALCAEGVRLAESGKLAEALETMTRGVEAAPERAAAYNDRAQLLRLMQKDDGWYKALCFCNSTLLIQSSVT